VRDVRVGRLDQCLNSKFAAPSHGLAQGSASLPVIERALQRFIREK
jgi:hypothetical protein